MLKILLVYSMKVCFIFKISKNNNKKYLIVSTSKILILYKFFCSVLFLFFEQHLIFLNLRFAIAQQIVFLSIVIAAFHAQLPWWLYGSCIQEIWIMNRRFDIQNIVEVCSRNLCFFGKLWTLFFFLIRVCGIFGFFFSVIVLKSIIFWIHRHH